MDVYMYVCMYIYIYNVFMYVGMYMYVMYVCIRVNYQLDANICLF